MIYDNYIKRILDIVFASLGLVVLLIPLVIISIVIKIDSPGPVFFLQKRIGKDKRPFNILKFRSMYIDTPNDVPTHLLNNPDIMITGVGKFLRRTSIDELPQLINILRGEMSIVGPRPALWNQDDLIESREQTYNDKGNNINSLRPGLTGWAQINGRDEIAIDEKVAFDAYYLRNISLRMDLICIVRTISAVIKQEGYVEGKRE